MGRTLGGKRERERDQERGRSLKDKKKEKTKARDASLQSTDAKKRQISPLRVIGPESRAMTICSSRAGVSCESMNDESMMDGLVSSNSVETWGARVLNKPELQARAAPLSIPAKREASLFLILVQWFGF